MYAFTAGTLVVWFFICMRLHTCCKIFGYVIAYVFGYFCKSLDMYLDMWVMCLPIIGYVKWIMFGSGARFSAVWGSVYCLKRYVQALVMEEDKLVGVVCSSGQKIACK